jgi:DNA polymerase III epsilon subunit-like protein
MSDFAAPKIIFLDFEASSLSQDSWPIEIGLSWVEIDAVRTWSSLIRTDPSWDSTDWSPQSAAVHRISVENLRQAPTPQSVVAAFMTICSGAPLISDAPGFDQRWLDRLMHTQADARDLVVGDFHSAAFSSFHGYALDIVYESLERTRVPHRAGPDSARLARAWLAGQKV